jgi:DNA-binding transcriptional regulator WhiA
MNNELERSLLAKENISSNEGVPNPIFSQSTATSSNMIATATRKESNPFSILCGASISGGVITNPEADKLHLQVSGHCQGTCCQYLLQANIYLSFLILLRHIQTLVNHRKHQ